MKPYKLYLIIRRGVLLDTAETQKEALQKTKQHTGTLEVWETIVIEKRKVVPITENEM